MANGKLDFDLASCRLLKIGIMEETPLILNLYHPVLMTSITRGPIALHEDLLRRAFCAVCFRHPIMRARRDSIRLRDTLAIPSDEYCTSGRLEHLENLPVFLHQSESKDKAWHEALDKERKQPWESSFVFQIDAYLLDPSHEKGICCVMVAHFNHGIGDGLAFCTALSDYLRALNSCAPDGSLPQLSCLGQPKEIPKFTLERYPNYTLLDRDAVSEEERARLFGQCIERVRENVKLIKPLIYEERLTKEQSARFFKACKNHGVSFTSAVYAAMLIASNASSVASIMPINIRTQQEMGDICSCIRVMPFILKDIDKEALVRKDLWAIAAHFGRIIASIRTQAASPAPYQVSWMSGIPLTLMIPDAKMMQQGMYSMGDEAISQKRMGTFLSNLGMLDNIFSDSQGRGYWKLEDIACFCDNKYALVDGGVWSLTYNNRIHLAFLDSTPPHQEAVFEAYAKVTMQLIASSI